MAKKSRRIKASKRTKATTVNVRKVEPLDAVTTAPTLQAKPVAKVQPQAQSSAGQYQYVITDVRHIGILAASIVVILVVLSFILG
ncbi:MAG: hypothetical protein U9Q31_00845 [Chloroflexota bacterium]|nr:hypothetical protein [Chloroflexota bacterium]